LIAPGMIPDTFLQLFGFAQNQEPLHNFICDFGSCMCKSSGV